MSNPEAEPTRTLASWLPFMCPSCRGLFRAPSDHQGLGKCPVCEETIQFTIPSELAAGINPASTKRRRSNQGRPQKVSSWEQDPSPRVKGSSSGWPISLTLILLATAGAVLGGLYLYNRFSPAKQPPRKIATAEKLEQSFSVDRDADADADALADFSRDHSTRATRVVRKFLEAETVDDLYPLIRRGDEIQPLLRSYYHESGYQAPGAYEVNGDGQVQVTDKFASFKVVMGDYSERLIAVEFTEEGPLVDWESWVGYCDVPWEKFIQQKVRQPTLVRVYAKRSYYYNYDFTDDQKWVCFELLRGPDEPTLYGYCSPDAPFINRLPPPDGASTSCILQVQFQKDSRAKDQVLITDFLNEGWVLGLHPR